MDIVRGLGEAAPVTVVNSINPYRIDGQKTAAFEVVDALSAWAASHDHSLLELAFAWLIEKPVIPSVIAGATKADQVRANAAAADWRLSAEEAAEVDALAPIVT